MYTAYLLTEKPDPSEYHILLAKYGLSPPLIRLTQINQGQLPNVLLDKQVVVCDLSGSNNVINSLRRAFPGKVWNINSKTNPMAAWELIYLQNHILNHKPNFSDAKRNFSVLFKLLTSQRTNYINLLGTGPFLDGIDNLDFTGSISIGANTIIKNLPTLDIANLKVLVAGDALYHFSFTRHAEKFREDLRVALTQFEIYFIYPAVFDCFVRREFQGFHHRLIPIPIGKHSSILNNLRVNFSLPSLPNVLGLLLLPLATNFSTRIRLLGFDGRSPFDSGFWSNSAKHSYPELISEMQMEYPAFYESHVPLSDPLKYQKSTSDRINQEIKIAKDKGWEINLLHPSWNQELNLLYNQDEIYRMLKARRGTR